MPLVDTKPDAVARVYARSLLLSLEAQHQGDARTHAVEETLGQLEDILDLARVDAKFGEFLSSRVVPAERRRRSLETIFRGRVADRVLNFLQVLNEKGRIASLPQVVGAFDNLVQERFGRIEVDVYAAEPLSGPSLEMIRGRLSAVLKKQVIVHPYIDAAVIGGVRIQVGDQLIDASVATQLRRMRDRLANEGQASLKAHIDRAIEG